MYQCKQCTQSFELYDSLRRHVGRIHKIHASQSYITYVLNGLTPKCECGCGEAPKWRAGSFQRFINGHNSDGKLNPMFGKKHSDESRQGMSKTRKAKFASGETHMWSEGLSIKTSEKLQKMAQKISENAGRAQKISDALIGRTHSAEHNKNSTAAIKKAWESPELRDKQRVNRFEYFKDTVKKHNTGIELKMMKFLDTLKIEYEHPFFLGGKIYDFKLTRYLVVIETDGDFYHCNPNNHPVPIYEIQKKSVENDKLKNEIAKSAGYTLLRFWESDINENPQKVIQTILDAIK